jgi:hypothetical protein
MLATLSHRLMRITAKARKAIALPFLGPAWALPLYALVLLLVFGCCSARAARCGIRRQRLAAIASG